MITWVKHAVSVLIVIGYILVENLFCNFTSVYIIFVFIMPMMQFFITFISGYQLTQKERKPG